MQIKCSKQIIFSYKSSLTSILNSKKIISIVHHSVENGIRMLKNHHINKLILKFMKAIRYS